MIKKDEHELAIPVYLIAIPQLEKDFTDLLRNRLSCSDGILFVLPDSTRKEKENASKLSYKVTRSLKENKRLETMHSPSTHYVPTRRMGIYDPVHHIGMWEESYKVNGCFNTSTAILEVEPKLDNQSEDTSHGTVGHTSHYNEEATKPFNKVQRRLAQNREAARKSRLRKKAYVQQLETSRLKLIQLEEELYRARQPSLYVAGGLDASQLGFSPPVNPGIAAFEMAYAQWVQEQDRQVAELRSALQAQITDEGLVMFVNRSMNHYYELFRMKATASKADVVYLMSGMWRTTAERFCLWIGGFRSSELLKVLVPATLREDQIMEVCKLKQACQQAEDALSQGMDKLQQNVVDTVAGGGRLGEGNYNPQITSAMEKLEDLVSFVTQADLIRQLTLHQMSRILSTRQAAQCLLALGEYFQRLRDLSSLWATRPCEPA